MTTKRERALRANPTVPEKRLWRLLHPLRTNGFHFRRQEQIGPFYADFACHHAGLVIEVDGETHVDIDHDERRTAYLRDQGYTVLRVTNDDVLSNPDGVYAAVTAALEGRRHNLRSRRPKPIARRPLPIPPHEGEGDLAATANLQNQHAEGL